MLWILLGKGSSSSLLSHLPSQSSGWFNINFFCVSPSLSILFNISHYLYRRALEMACGVASKKEQVVMARSDLAKVQSKIAFTYT